MEYSRRLKLTKSRILNTAREIELDALDDIVVDEDDDELDGSISESQLGESESSRLSFTKNSVSGYNRWRSKNILGRDTGTNEGNSKGSKRNLFRGQSKQQLSDRSREGSASSISLAPKPSLPLVYKVENSNAISPSRKKEGRRGSLRLQTVPEQSSPLPLSLPLSSNVNPSDEDSMALPLYNGNGEEIRNKKRFELLTEDQEKQLLLEAMEASMQDFKQTVIEPEEEEYRQIVQAMEASMLDFTDFVPDEEFECNSISHNPCDRKNRISADQGIKGKTNGIAHLYPSMDDIEIVSIPPIETVFQAVDLEYSQRFLDYNGVATTDGADLINSIVELSKLSPGELLSNREWSEPQMHNAGQPPVFVEHRQVEPKLYHPSYESNRSSRSPCNNNLSKQNAVEEAAIFEKSLRGSARGCQLSMSTHNSRHLETDGTQMSQSCRGYRGTPAQSNAFPKNMDVTSSKYYPDNSSVTSATDILSTSSQYSGASGRNSDEIEIQVSPGCYLPLYGSQETKEAIRMMVLGGRRCGHPLVELSECLSCSTKLYCVSKANAVICYRCHEISPVTFHNDFIGTRPVADGNGGGVGLGIPELTYLRCKKEFEAMYAPETLKKNGIFIGNEYRAQPSIPVRDYDARAYERQESRSMIF